jgi:hypothetical protein
MACRVLGQHRSTQRKIPTTPDDEAALTADIVALAVQYGRYGYRRITAMLRTLGWTVNLKRVERIWRREGLKVPQRQPKRARLWLNDGSCIRLRPEHPNHVWSYDFVEARTHDGRKVRMLNVLDEYTRECLAIRVARKLKGADVIDVLSDLFILRGVPGHVRSDNGPEFVEGSVLDQGGGCEDRLHCSGLTVGERLHRELQLEAPGRTAQRRDLLHPPGGQGRHRGMAQALQHHPPTLIPRLRPACTRGSAMAGCATPASSAGHPSRGAPNRHALTFNLDHLMGAGHAMTSQLAFP